MKTLNRILVSFAVVAIALSGFTFNRTQARDDTSIDVKVMTYNVDEGTDLGPLVAATSLNDLLNAVAFVYKEVQASNVPERSRGFAQKVEETLPDFIALQELSTWSTGPIGQPPATIVQIDQLQSILQALSERGLSYSPLAISTNIDAEVPSALGVDVRLVDYDAVLVRTQPVFTRRTTQPSPLKVTGIQVQRFTTNLSFTSPLFGTFSVPRGWISVDATTSGKPFRFVTTHLESFSSAVRLAQAQELVAGPLSTTRPLIFAADINSDAESNDPDQNGAYRTLRNGFLDDAWTSAHPGQSGFTWPLHGEDPFTPVTTPNQRIDVILSRQLHVVSAVLVGANPSTDLTPSGLWISDHAGVVATFELEHLRRFPF